MTTTAQHIAARDDRDLQQRLIAAAEQAGIPNAASIVAGSLGALVSRPITVNGEQTSLTAVHAYASAVRSELLEDDRLLPPGLNPGAVTDAHLTAAVLEVLSAPAEPEA